MQMRVVPLPNYLSLLRLILAVCLKASGILVTMILLSKAQREFSLRFFGER